MPLESEREVKKQEVIPYAKKGCRICAGSGFVTIDPVPMMAPYHERKGDGTIVNGERKVKLPREVKLCGCAILRFMRKNKGALDPMPAKGEAVLRWKNLQSENPASIVSSPGGTRGEASEITGHLSP